MNNETNQLIMIYDEFDMIGIIEFFRDFILFFSMQQRHHMTFKAAPDLHKETESSRTYLLMITTEQHPSLVSLVKHTLTQRKKN